MCEAQAQEHARCVSCKQWENGTASVSTYQKNIGAVGGNVISTAAQAAQATNLKATLLKSGTHLRQHRRQHWTQNTA